MGLTRPSNTILSAPLWALSDRLATVTVRVQLRVRLLRFVSATHRDLPLMLITRPGAA